MEKIDYILSDEFVAFSQKIAAIHAKKKKKKEELRQYYETVQAEIRELDAEAKKLHEEFEQWKKSQTETGSNDESA